MATILRTGGSVLKQEAGAVEVSLNRGAAILDLLPAPGAALDLSIFRSAEPPTWDGPYVLRLEEVRDDMETLWPIARLAGVAKTATGDTVELAWRDRRRS